MAKKEYKLTKFSGGISDDIRQSSETSYSLSQHFDINTSPYRSIPFRDSEADNTTQVGIMNFAWDKTNSFLYGLGLTLSGGLKIQIYRKTTANDLTSAWLTPTSSTSTAVTHMLGNLFIFYKGVLYLRRYTNAIDTFDPSGPTYTDTAHVFGSAYTDGSGQTTQGLIHSKTDTLYIGDANIIWSNNNGTINSSAFIVPSDMIITSLAEYGSYLAIACKPKTASLGGTSTSSSKVFLWDMVSSTPTEVLDFGVGDLWILANVEGFLVGVMNSSPSAGITFSKSKIYIKTYAGGTPTLFKSLEDDGLVLFGLFGYKPFFSTINGLTFGLYSSGSRIPTGLYTFSRPSVNYPFSITMERLIHNATSITSLTGIFKVGEVVFTAYNFVLDTSSNVGRTNDTASYTATSALNTQRFGIENPRQKKSLLGVTVSFDPLPSGASVVLKYKKDEETSFTTIFTYSTQNGIYHSSTTIESSGVKLPDFREIEFRVESTGGAIITGFYSRVEDKNDDLYE